MDERVIDIMSSIIEAEEVLNQLDNMIEENKSLTDKVNKLEDALNYVLTAKPEHYHNMENMLEDFKTVINLTLNTK